MDELTEIYNEIGNEVEVFEPRPREPDKKSKAHTYLQSVVEQIEPLIYWDNEKLEQHRRLIWLKMSLLYKKKSDTGIRLFIDWCRGKKLHPLQVVKTINKMLK